MFDKKDLLQKVHAFKEVKENNGPKDNSKLDKSGILSKVKETADLTHSTNSRFLNKVPKQDDLSMPVREDSWKSKSSLKDIHKKIFMESAVNNGNKPNAFRLNLETLVLDKAHGKFKIQRGPTTSIFEILYPNANGKITLKVEVDDVEDRIIEIGLEDEEYVKNFSNFIIKNVDEMLAEKQTVKPTLGTFDTVDGVVNKTYAPQSVTGFSPIWEALMSIVEADDLSKPGNNDNGDEELEGEDKPETEATPGESFGEDDFKLDTGETKLGDLGGNFGGGSSFGGGSGMSDGFGSGDVNKSDNGEQSGQTEAAPEYSNFRDKTDWSNDALNAMQKLVSTDVAKKMQSGSGVVLTQDEILNGMPGIKGDANGEIVDKFLKIYKELDGVEITEDLLNEVEDKLSLNDGQFDSWLQAKLPELTGVADVDETLNNEMFDNFKPMGGENQPAVPGEEVKNTETVETPEVTGMSPTGETPEKEESLSDFLSSMKETGSTENKDDQALKEKAEAKVPGEIKNPFPNLG